MGKKYRALLIVALMATTAIHAQDVIVTRQSERIDAKVLKVSETEIEYKKTSNPDGPTFSLSTAKISSIIYANGEVQSFTGNAQEVMPPAKTTPTHSKPNLRLYRNRGLLVQQDMPYEPENLRQLLGNGTFEAYLAYQSKYNAGGAFVTLGWVSAISGAVIALTGAINEDKDIYLAGVLVASLGDIFLPIGYITRGVAAGNISRIADRYNAGELASTGIQLGVTPALLATYDGHAAPGVGLQLRF